MFSTPGPGWITSHKNNASADGPGVVLENGHSINNPVFVFTRQVNDAALDNVFSVGDLAVIVGGKIEFPEWVKMIEVQKGQRGETAQRIRQDHEQRKSSED